MKRWTLGIGITLAVLVLVLTITFSIGQPFLWRWLFDEPPPSTATDLASLLQVLVAIVGLGIAGFGFLVYQLVKSMLRQDLQARSEEITEEVLNKTTQAGDYALMKLNLQQALTLWEHYRDEWSRKGYPQDLDEAEKFRAKAAYSAASRALGIARRLPIEDYRGQLQEARNTTAFHLGSLRERENDALALIREMEADPRGLRVEHKETVAWVHLRFQHDENRARQLLREVWRDQSPALTRDIREELTDRYSRLFGLDITADE